MKLVHLTVLVAGLVPGCQTKGVLQAPELSLERMLHQQKYGAFQENSYFVDRRAMRTPPAGTVSRDEDLGHPEVTHGVDGDRYVTAIPVHVTRALIERGHRRFTTYCAACHGELGDGDSTVARKMSIVRPANLLSDKLRGYPPGRLYRVIREGFGAMPSYAAELTIEERWGVVAYVRALQRAAGVRLEDLPAELEGEARKALE